MITSPFDIPVRAVDREVQRSLETLIASLGQAPFLERSVRVPIDTRLNVGRDVSYFLGTYKNSTDYAIGYNVWREAGRTTCTAGGTVAYTANRLVAIPFVVDAPFRIDRLAFHCTLAGAGSAARVGIYASVNDARGDLYPGALLVDGGSQATTGTGLKTSTVSVDVEPGRLYWAAYVCSATAPTVRSLPVAALYPMLSGITGTGTAAGWGVYVTFTYGSLPAVFPREVGATMDTSANAPAIRFRQAIGTAWTRTVQVPGHAIGSGRWALRRALLLSSSTIEKASRRSEYLTIEAGVRDGDSVRYYGDGYDSRSQRLVVGTPLRLTGQSDVDAVLPGGAILEPRFTQGGWPAMERADLAVQYDLAYQGVN